MTGCHQYGAIIAVNDLVLVINPGISDECPFCFQKENMFRARTTVSGLNRFICSF